MAKTATYSLISNTTLGSAQSTVTISSIPATFTDLLLVSSVAFTSAVADSVFTFNTDTATNYSFTALYGNGTTATSARSANRSNISLYEGPSTTLGGSNSLLHILDYANTTTYKTTLSRGNTSASGTGAVVGLWRSTAAINQIVIGNNGGTTFVTGSNFKLYGIEAYK